MAMQLVSTVNVTSTSVSSIEWTSIPQTGKDLYVLFSGRGTVADLAQTIDVRWNSLSSNYNYVRFLRVYNSTISSNSAGPSQVPILVPAATATASIFGNISIYLPNYTSSQSKTISADYVGENDSTFALAGIVGGENTNTAAITSLSLVGNLVRYTTASLYIIS